MQKLPDTLFGTIIEHAPLIAIDLCVLNARAELLLGYRNNRPAQHCWFVPGGRIRKGEKFTDAFARITTEELGSAFALSAAEAVGSYEHFYEDNVYGTNFGTHYVVLAYVLRIAGTELPLSLLQLSLQQNQHEQYRWFTLRELEADPDIHANTRAYVPALKTLILP